MRHVSLKIGAVSVFFSIACGGELRAPSERDPVNPRAPQAAFDAGANPLGAGLSAAPPPSDDMSGMSGMPGMSGMTMPMPSSSTAPASSGPRR